MMCGRFALTHVAGFWSRFAVIDRRAQLVPRYNIAPSQTVPVIISRSENKAVMMKWGLVPFWAKDPKIGNRLINARAESIATRPAFRTSYVHKRCLVPATGYYEWKHSEDGKIPYYVHMKDDSFFAFAGLYDNWIDEDGNELYTFTITTTRANKLSVEVHNRMPVILRISDEDIWLAKGPLADSDRGRMLGPYPSRELEIYEVSTEVNSTSNDSKELINPAHYGE